MIVLDVNVLIFAFRQDVNEHEAYAPWLTALIHGVEPYAAPDTVISGLLRIITHPRVFAEPSTIDSAIEFVSTLILGVHARPARTTLSFWGRFLDLCRSTKARGNQIPDTYLAAVAIDLEAELITAGQGFQSIFRPSLA